jgi:GDPmannose 4,6-dehydratase
MDHVDLGNLDAIRDWGHSKDYTRAMRSIIRHEAPDDFVVATGIAHSVREMLEFVFGELGLDPARYVHHADRLCRPQELPRLRGDSSKTRKTFGWTPEYTWETMLREMIKEETLRSAARASQRS